MTTRLALILSGVWTLVVIGICSGALWFVTAKVPRHEQEQRAAALGGSTATVAVIGYAAIIFPWAIAFRRRRDAARAADNDDEDDEPRPAPRKRKKP